MTITYRKATVSDNYTTFTIFQKSLLEFSERTGVLGITGGQGPDQLATAWARRISLWEHLSQTADQYWLAEKNGEPVGYARSILRDGVRELTEFFVAPEYQSIGVGKELLDRAFPKEGAKHRVIIATNDPRALSRYIKTGVYPYVPQMFLENIPHPVTVDTDLDIIPMRDIPNALEIASSIDLNLLGHRRDIDQRWLMEVRTGYFYKRGQDIVGYGYIHKDYYGPFAALNKDDFPAILAHAENQAHALGSEWVGFEVPLINRVVMDYLLARKYKMSGFLGSIMSDEPFGKFENYLLTSPPYFL
jgi:GNAT superfamily N-acetyltransferase